MARTRHDLEALWSNCAREARALLEGMKIRIPDDYRP